MLRGTEVYIYNGLSIYYNFPARIRAAKSTVYPTIKEVKAAVGLQAQTRETAAPGVCVSDYIVQVNLGEPFRQATVTVARRYSTCPPQYSVFAHSIPMNAVERKFSLLLFTDCKLSAAQ